MAKKSRFSERVGAGDTVPAGECPECGALAHVVIEGDRDD